ncbi:zinc/cadmium/mercury/lead-transporting ATPase [Shewanella surugensis]|uniref:P-type Zn(2+) transporter n=1 Tax=Shewanella surugensis TaxID=212020 RepID=A0ABT0LCE8_9GAMM|nr:zinc/cadmium/mercury/lead-transporting ATPase [Shewanella surugensis]MCL1125020.1 zinc/cadmium/mercury/lead-transporting ATPase [Shewanella surugensis]
MSVNNCNRKESHIHLKGDKAEMVSNNGCCSPSASAETDSIETQALSDSKALSEKESFGQSSVKPVFLVPIHSSSQGDKVLQAPPLPAHKHSHDHSQSCGSETTTLSDTKAEEQALEAALSQIKSGYSQTWTVLGMDCPSCANKLEKALMSLKGVDSAKVMFATEKLIVHCQSESMVSQIEAKAMETGVRLASGKVSKDKVEQSFMKQNLSVIVIAVMMLFSFIISQYFVAFGSIAFTITTVLGLLPVVKKATLLARSGTPFSIETLMSVAAIGALYLGATAEAGMVLLLFLIGERLEGYAAARARSGVKALMNLVPEEAVVIRDGGSKVNVSVADLIKGDVIEVAPGSRLPADSQLIDIIASFDESALTGESIPVEHVPGDKIMAGSLVTDKVVRLTIISAQGENAIDRILHLIEDAESRKAPLERFLDRFSRWYTPAMIVLAALVIVIPPLFFAQVWSEWIYRGLTLLLIACPCALVISTPAAITSGLAAAARRGALIKGGAALEQLGRINTVAFDKTGTLTQGQPAMTDLVCWDGDEDKLLKQAAAVEMGSLHPLAIAVVNAAIDKGWLVDEAEEREALPGLGIRGIVAGQQIQLYAADRLPLQITLTDKQQSEAIALEAQGKTLVIVLRDSVPIGMIAWRDNLRSDAKEAILALKGMGINSLMLTGDNQRAAAAIAAEIGVDFQAGLLPADKVTAVEQANIAANVAMVGDGINDAPAMKTASIGIAMGGGTDVALETADAALTHNRLTELPVMIELSQATLGNIRQNITLAIGLKAILLVTTLLGLTGLWLAILADSGATALVTLNALRLLRFKPKKR